MLNSQKREKYQVFFLPILLRKTRQSRDVTYDVIDKLRRLGLSKCFLALCHKLIYEIAIFHSINGETCDKYHLLTMLFVYWFLLSLRLVWLLVCCLYKEVYLQIFECVSFWLHGCCGEWEGGPVNQVNQTSWVAVVTPTDRPKSVRNCCLIELFVALFVLSLCPFDISVGVGAFVIGLGQISSFLSSPSKMKY